MPSSPLGENGSLPVDPFTIRRRLVVEPIRALAFWTAIALPFLYLPLLWYGLESTGELIVFFGLVALNLLALLVGHGYDPRDTGGDSV